MVGVFLPVIIFVSYTGWKIERIKIALQKQYAAYQKSDEKQKMENDIAKKRQKLNEQSASLKNTKVLHQYYSITCTVYSTIILF